MFFVCFFFVGTLETVSVRNAIDSRLAGNPTCELNTHRGKTVVRRNGVKRGRLEMVVVRSS